MATIPEYDENLLAPVKEDPNVQAWNDSPFAGALFGWGTNSYNRKVDRKLAEINKVQDQLGKARFATIEEAVQANAVDWNELQNEILGEDGQRLDQQIAGWQGSDQDALAQLKRDLSMGYKSQSDLMRDQSLYGDVGDVANMAVPTAETVAAQRDALQQFKNLSTPRETAEEQLMRMTAQRAQEGQQRGDREALAERLKSRGVYGSGAEVLGALASQGTNAQTRSMAQMQANANASQRALAALGKYSDLSSQMRGAETQEGSLANQVQQFNNQINQGVANQRSGATLQAQAADNNAGVQRAGTIYNASDKTTGNARRDESMRTATLSGLTQGKTGNRTQGAGLTIGGIDKVKDELDEAEDVLGASKKTGGALGISFG